MMNRIDLLAGAVVCLFGILACAYGMSYDLGTPRNIGPGFFPTALGAIAVLIGVAIAATGLFSKTEPQGAGAGAAAVGPLIVVMASIAVFALLVKWAGLVPAVFGSALVSTFASGRPSWSRALLLPACIAGVCALMFIYGLGLPIRMFGS